MSKYCATAGCVTNCTEECKNCAKEIYRDLKGMAGSAELVTEEAIKNDLGEGAFELLRKYELIECCGVINGTKRYAI